VTLASIVEKETGKADERPRVARVFLNRLSKRMKLQSDPTIVYGLVQGKGSLGRGILKSEVEKPTPYNTYVIEGLPPGPIANPGRAALEAVANPARTNDLYFVADGTGGHAFAETIDQHNKNVLRWRQIEKDAKEKQATPQPAADVDHVDPDATPTAPATPAAPPRPAARRDQRGELVVPTVPVFGALPTLFDSPEGGTALAYAAMPQSGALPITTSPPAHAATAPAAVEAATAPTKSAATPPAAAVTAKSGKAMAFASFSTSPNVTAALEANFGEQPLSALDGPAGNPIDEAVDSNAYPLSAAKLADLRSREAKFGVAQADTNLPAAAFNDARQSAVATDAGGPKIIRIYDASEGTPLDPLKDKTWDLNSPKTVPIEESELKPAAAKPATKTASKAAKQARARKHD
jgi:UPF0755 protein